MLFIDTLVERQIREAQQLGEFDNLPGAGKPLSLDDDSHVPESLRLSYRILKMSGFLPVELQLRQEAITLQELIDQAVDEETLTRYRKKLEQLKLKLTNAGLSTQFLDSPTYGAKISATLLKP